MRQLGRRLARVSDASTSSPSPPEAETPKWRGVGKAGATVPEGHVSVHVGEEGPGGEAERFLVRAELLGRPALAELLGRAAQEYGYGRRGPLRIPCSVLTRRLPPRAREPRRWLRRWQRRGRTGRRDSSLETVVLVLFQRA
ncbi:SAUR14 - auxin-responsive SAUR family member [Panicum miliaceum]|uniref:SAUR14-auxin-responsive SAUR family member n=1 Tax=Panicum miliaceum TaxID=4540 RepID=A0A3L6TKL4_PANMI|nr:SAUR14 - auxin-responsive SAUR family member [Panicum miliaceum]